MAIIRAVAATPPTSKAKTKWYKIIKPRPGREAKVNHVKITPADFLMGVNLHLAGRSEGASTTWTSGRERSQLPHRG